MCCVAQRSQVRPDVVGVRNAEGRVEGQGALPVPSGQAVLACRVMSVSETSVGAGLLESVTSLDGQSEPGRVLGARLLGLACGVQGFPNAVQCLGFAVAVTGLAEEGESLPQIVGRPLVMTLPQINDAKIDQC